MSRHATAWDMAALRMSSLYANDMLPETSRVAMVKSVHGVRHLPLALGRAAEVGLPVDEAPEPRRTRRDTLDLAPMSMVLRSDTQAPLSPSAVHDGVSYATAQLRRQRRVVGGSVERASPYWRARRSAGLLPGVRPDGPQRARLPVMRGEWERYQAAYLRMLSLSRKAKAPEPAASEDESDSDGVTPPGEHRRQLVNMVNEVLPRLAEWDEADERQLREGRFGWLYAAPCDARVPRSVRVLCLHRRCCKRCTTTWRAFTIRTASSVLSLPPPRRPTPRRTSVNARETSRRSPCRRWSQGRRCGRTGRTTLWAGHARWPGVWTPVRWWRSARWSRRWSRSWCRAPHPPPHAPSHRGGAMLRRCVRLAGRRRQRSVAFRGTGLMPHRWYLPHASVTEAACRSDSARDSAP